MWNEVKKDEKEGHCSGCKRCVLCRNAYDHRLRLGRCCGSSHKHLEHSQIADSVGGEQCCFSEETIIQNNADVLNDIYSDDSLTTDNIDEYANTVIPEMADASAVSEENDNLSAQSDIQVMILAENMAGFADENKVSEGVNFSDTNENANSMNQLMINTQAQ